MPDEASESQPPAEFDGLNPGALFAHVLRSPQTGPHSWMPLTVEELQRVLPQYEIVEIVGRGGMGAVYKARHKSLERYVAIKVLPVGIEHDEMEYAARFQREARAMARLSHPGIVAVHDTGETANGQLYIVMEFIEGTDLQHILESGRLPPREAVAIVIEICEALDYAHRSGVIHRDIKPSNIMIDAIGRVKVADFGLAKLTVDDAALLTQTNLAMGSPDFIAPEAVGGTGIDHRADLYAVGVILYRMLTGKLPRGRFGSPSGVVEGLDPRFDAIVDRALQAEPGARYSSAIELRSALESALAPAKDVPAPVTVAKPARATWKIGLAIATTLAIAAAVFYGLRRPSLPSATDPAANTAEVAEKSARPAPGKYPPGKWVKAWPNLEVIPGIRVTSDGWATLKPPEKVLRVPEAFGSNWAVRAQFRSGPKGSRLPKLILRHDQRLGYNASLDDRGVLILRRNDPAVPTGNIELNSTETVVVQPEEEFVFMFAAIGQTLIAWVNGQSLSTQIEPTQNSSLAGAIRIHEVDVTAFRDVEVMNLDGVPEIEALKLFRQP
jgi:serine/threonine protein kinase